MKNGIKINKMTTRQKIELALISKGIFEPTATKIMDCIIPLIDAEMDAEGTPRITWNLPANGYPDALYAVLFLTHINKHVLAWAEENMPRAWWKPMFLPADDRERLFAGMSEKVDDPLFFPGNPVYL